MSDDQHKPAIYLLPYLGIGGVELAAQTLLESDAELLLSVQTVYDSASIQQQGLRQTFDPLRLIRCAWHTARQRPQVLIVSLWRAYIVGVLVKVFRPQIKLVTFIHNTRDEHIVDRIITRLVLLLSHEVWGDCDDSLLQRSRLVHRKPRKVISFLLQRWPAVTTALSPHCIYWGRLASQKNIHKALRVFSHIKAVHPQAVFTIAGPDNGCKAELQHTAQALGLVDAVTFIGAIDHATLAGLAQNHTFFLMTSDYEGMAVSVVEAMQLGLVPVVTPVGEIANYCRDGESAVFVNNEAAAGQAVCDLLANPERLGRMRQCGIGQWQGEALYKDDIHHAVRALLRVD